MGEPHVISAFRAKRARLAGEIIHAQEVVARCTKELVAVDTVILLFSPDCDPDMIAPIRPASHGLFFRYRELGRLSLGILRAAKGPMTPDRIVDQVIEAKGLPADRRLRKHVMDSTRATLMRMARKGWVRRALDQPEAWWELVTPLLNRSV